MITWVISAAEEYVRVTREAQNNKMEMVFSAEGGGAAHLAEQLKRFLEANPVFEALVLSADSTVVRLYREALEPDLARFVVAEYSKADPKQFTDRPTERYKKHANPKGRRKKWR